MSINLIPIFCFPKPTRGTENNSHHYDDDGDGSMLNLVEIEIFSKLMAFFWFFLRGQDVRDMNN
jgi:hypothetical protein